MKLSIVLATRGRPALLERTIAVTLANMRHDATQLVVAIDDDDAETMAAVGNSEILERHDVQERVSYSIAPREDTLGGKYNRVLDVAPADVYLAMVDYAPHVTKGFDVKVLEAAAQFPDGIGVVYNHLANLSFPQINAVTAGLVRHMGYVYPPHFPYWFVDHWLDDIAKLIGRIAFADVWIDCSLRPGTQDRRDTAFWATFYDAAAVHRRRIAHDIIDSPEFEEAEWRKRLLKRGHPLIEERSVMINNAARGIAWPVTPEAVDDRYRRVKTAAKEMLRTFLADLDAEEATRQVNAAAAA